MNAIWQHLFANVALVAIVMFSWEFIADYTAKFSTTAQSCIFGLLMATGAVVSMRIAGELIPGLLFDLRSPLVAAAGFFGGVPAAVIALVAAVIFRLYLGGTGAMAGSLAILIAGSIGILGYFTVRSRTMRYRDIATFALALAVTTPLAFFVLPAEIWRSALSQTGTPIAALTFLSAILIGLIFYRERRRRALTSANAMYRSMVDALPDCLNVKDVDGRFVAANPETARLMRAGSADALLGKTDFDFYPADIAQRFRADELGLVQSGEVLRIDQRALFPDDSTGWLSTLKVPLRDHTGAVVGIITHNRDITEQVKNATIKNEFISTVSHELRTPLTSIRGSLGLIAAGVAGPLPERATNLVRIAHTNSERLVRLINDILDMEKIESGKMNFARVRQPILPLVQAAIEANSDYMIERQVTVSLVDEAPGVEVSVDADRLHQVLINLLSNAVKYSHESGAVTLRITSGVGLVRISIADRGAGIPEAFRARIFNKFERADSTDTREVGGTGLGLSIVKAILERLDGKVWFDTEIGVGSTFHVELPDAGILRNSVPEPSVPGQAVRNRVLICEDEPDIAEVIRLLLEQDNFVSDVAPDIATARALLGRNHYVAMTLDVRLAEESGLQLFRDIRASHGSPDIPVVVISAIADESRKTLNGAAFGIIDWIEKPVDPLRLHNAMNQVLDRSHARRPKVLHVDDDQDVLEVMSAGLGENVSTTFARSLGEARHYLSQHHFDLMILDIALPDGSGIDLLPEAPPETAVIIFSATDFDEGLAGRVQAVMTKTKLTEAAVAQVVKNLVFGPDGNRRG